MARAALALLLALPAVHAPAQWADSRRLGNGGETFVSTDGAGTVYASSHLPTQVFVSRDWGATFGPAHTFDDALGDMVVIPRGKGQATVVYMPPAINGLVTHTSDDYGATWTRGAGITDRPLDREWPAYCPKTKAVYMVYSDGYIGGPKSKGVFVSKSLDGGLTWKETARADREPEGSYAIDPHIAVASDGKVHAYWTSTTDYNTIDTYKTAFSTDGGATFGEPVTVQTVTKGIGDTQERWMLGGIAAHGASDLMAFFVDYVNVEATGKQRPTLAVFARFSKDGGKTFGERQTVCSLSELQRAHLGMEKKRLDDGKDGTLRQCLVWGFYDPLGRPHVVWQDSRDGQGVVGDQALPRWHVRHAMAPSTGAAFGPSEAVSRSVTCRRPPLDFLCAAADSRYVYVTWTETPQNAGDWNFSGEFWFARKPLAPKE